MLKRNLDRFYYLLLLISLKSAYCIIRLLLAVHFLFRKTKKEDVIFFPHEQKGSDGYTKRHEQYFPFFKKDKVSFYVCDLYPDSYIKKNLFGSKFQQYYLYHLIIWKRIKQVIKARHYKAAFIHRRLFAYYPDSTTAHLEKLLRKLNDNITVDYWDSVWLSNPSLYQDIILYVDKISVVNQFVYDYFKEASAKKYLFPIALTLENYEVKPSYELNDPIKLLWTGLAGSLPQVQLLATVLQDISKKYKICLVIISSGSILIDGVNVLHYKWDKETFSHIIASCDIGLYPFENTTDGKGKMAMKVIEYMACGVPTVGTSVGLTPFAKNNDSILLAETLEQWKDGIIKLIENKDLRMRIAKNGRSLVENYHSVEKSYITYKKIIFST